MSNLKERLLSSVELHGKCDIHGLLKIYPDVSMFSVLKNLFILRNEGWIKINKYRVIEGVKTHNPNVFRTKKNIL